MVRDTDDPSATVISKFSEKVDLWRLTFSRLTQLRDYVATGDAATT